MKDDLQMIPELRDAIGALTIVDTHEHLPQREDAWGTDGDLLSDYLIHYFSRDLISAGLPPADCERARDDKRPVAERFALLAPYWEASRLTGYGRALDIAARDIYGIDGIRAETIEPLNDAFVRAKKAGGHYRRVLKELSNIETSVLDVYPPSDLTDIDRDYFQIAYNIGPLIAPGTVEVVDQIAERAGMRPRCFQDWLDIVEANLEYAFANGALCLKCAIAYNRSLHFPMTSFSDAEAGWIAERTEGKLTYWNSPRLTVGEDFTNYMMHFVLRWAERRGIAIQIHTGLQEGNGNVLANSNPLLLTNLLLQYPQLRFDLFHIAYPFTGELGAMCKNFPNAFIDMCWAHIISPRASVLALDEWLDAVPYNKISAFGGDYCFVDGVYAHQLMARDNVCKTLSRKVLAGEMGEQKAMEVARALFVDNPKRILGIK